MLPGIKTILTRTVFVTPLLFQETTHKELEGNLKSEQGRLMRTLIERSVIGKLNYANSNSKDAIHSGM